jgi:hypothetical protein
MSFARLACSLLSLLLVASACGGSPSDGADGSDGPPAGGSTATGGSASGGSNATGGQVATGGTTTSGGAPATGGTASASGGSTSAASGWEEIRCWQYGVTTTVLCYGRLGNLWANVAHVCTAEGDPKNPMTRNETACGGADDSTGWDETWCDDLQCYGRLGDWLTGLLAPCELPDGELLTQTPTEALCGAAPEAPTGWENVDCYLLDVGVEAPFCVGFHGTYQAGFGLYPICDIEADTAEDYTEISPDQAFCN